MTTIKDVEKRLTRAQLWVGQAEKAQKENESDSLRSALQGLVAQTSRAHVASLLLLADDAASGSDWETVRQHAKRATVVDPNCAHGYYLIGRADTATGEPSKAKLAFAKAASVATDEDAKNDYIKWSTKAAAKEAKAATVDDADDDVPTMDVSGGGAPVVSEPEAAASAKEEKSTPYMPPPPVSGPRMEWYQSPTTVTVDIYAKGSDREASTVNIAEKRLEVKVVRPGQPDFELERDLFGTIDVAKSSWTATKYKFEIVLRKVSGEEWTALSSSAEKAELSAAEKARVLGEAKLKAAAASKKNWDAIAEKELEGEKDDDGPMALFRTIYKDADEDTQRAMMKSYQESGGKVLSTDWKDVGSRKVEVRTLSHCSGLS
jgi:SGS domain/CS domain